MREYTKIGAWKRSDDLTVSVYETTRTFPTEERYGLTSQIRRSAASVAANIVEGSSRNTNKDYLHFLYIARGSLSETQYFVHLSRRLGYLNATTGEELMAQTRQAFAALHGLIQAVEKESGKLTKLVASLSSLIALSVFRFTNP
jgi:four helix bundle protein